MQKQDEYKNTRTSFEIWYWNENTYWVTKEEIPTLEKAKEIYNNLVKENAWRDKDLHIFEVTKTSTQKRIKHNS